VVEVGFVIQFKSRSTWGLKLVVMAWVVIASYGRAKSVSDGVVRDEREESQWKMCER